MWMLKLEIIFIDGICGEVDEEASLAALDLCS